MTVFPNSLYRVPYWTPLIKTIASRIILHLSFSKTVLTPASAILLTDMRFLARPGMCNTPGRVLILPSFSNNFTLPRPMIFFGESSPRKTFPLYFSYSENHSLWGVIWKEAPESINQKSRSDCVLVEAKYTSPPSSEEGFFSVEEVSSGPFPLSTLFALQFLLKWPGLPHFQHPVFRGSPGDLDLPLDLDLPPIYLRLSLGRPDLTDKTSAFWLSIDFLLISSDSKDETISSNFNADFVLLPIATTRLSQESGREHSKVMHLSSSSILISTETSWLTRVLKTLRWSVTESPSSILRWYSFFRRNSLFTRDLDWYKFPNFSHNFFAESSPETFSSTES